MLCISATRDAKLSPPARPTDSVPRMNECPFCSPPPSSLWLECPSAVALWDGFPISEGHALVVPRQHAVSMFDLSASDLASVWEFVARVPAELKERFGVETFNIGLDEGQTAGQTVMPVLPRLSESVDGCAKGPNPNRAVSNPCTARRVPRHVRGCRVRLRFRPVWCSNTPRCIT